MSEGDFTENVTWSPRLEEYFKKTGEQAQCLSYLYNDAEQFYNKKRSRIDIPSNVLSSVVGFISVGSSSMFEGETKTVSIALGMGSLIVAVMNLIKQYYSYDKKAEGSRIASIQYGKLFRWIEIELGLPQEQRVRCGDLLKFVKDTINQLHEVSPPLPDQSIETFKRKFNKDTEVARPSVANGLERIVVYRGEGMMTNPLHTVRPTIRAVSSFTSADEPIKEFGATPLSPVIGGVK